MQLFEEIICNCWEIGSWLKITGNAYLLKFIYSEKDTIFLEISTVDLSYVGMVKSTVEISQNCVAFSECMNFEISEFICSTE